jgi:hypothetical protein
MYSLHKFRDDISTMTVDVILIDSDTSSPSSAKARRICGPM